MFEKEVEEIEKKAIKWVQNAFPNDEFKQSGISRALVDFAELGYNKAKEEKCELLGIIQGKDKVIQELEKENAELKQYAKALEETDNTNILHCMKVNGKLYKAKELLTKWVELFKSKGGNIPPTPIQVETEQFLSGQPEQIEKIKENGGSRT